MRTIVACCLTFWLGAHAAGAVIGQPKRAYQDRPDDILIVVFNGCNSVVDHDIFIIFCKQEDFFTDRATIFFSDDLVNDII